MLRHYLYISSTKVDAYWQQISNADKQKLQGELGINLGIVSAKAVLASDQSSTLIAKLHTVEAYVRRNEALGPAASECLWVMERLRVHHVTLPENPSIFLLSGVAGPVKLLLAGSAAHVVSGSPSETVRLGYSYLPHLARALSDVLDKRDAETKRDRDFRQSIFEDDGRLVPSIQVHELGDVVHRLSEEPEGEPLEVDFLGVRLFDGTSLYRSRTAVISPLYVSLATE